MNDEIAIGRIRKTHGVKGYLKILSFSGEYDHFFDLETLTLRKDGKSRTFQIEKIAPLGDEILLKLQGIDNPETGKLLSGWDIWVPRDLAANLETDEYYHADLIGCSLLCGGNEVGKVKAVLEAGADDLLEVKTEEGVKLIPFNPVFIGSVDTAKKQIELLEGWILD